MTLLLPFRRPLLGASWCRNVLWRNAKATPSLDLDFATRKSLADGVTGRSFVDFTRASSGTYVGSDGLIKTATTNLLLRSEEFNDAAWSKANATITANAIASPDGQQTADKLIENTAASVGHYVTPSPNPSTTAGQSYTYSVFAKAAERTFFQLIITAVGPSGGNLIAGFDLAGGIAGTPSSGSLSSITPLGNGWYRCSLSLTASATTTPLAQIRLALNSSASPSSYTGDGTSGIYIWGAQLEQSSTVGEYIPTTSTINSAPRFDHNPTTGESLGLLVEEQRTNSIRNNTMVGAVAGTPGTLPTNWVLQGGGVGTLSQQIVGTGTQNGINYIDIKYSGTTSTTDTRIAFEPSAQIVAATGQSWTASAYTAIIAGSLSNISAVEHAIIERNATGGFLGESVQAVNATNSLVRGSVSRTFNDANAARVNSQIKLSFLSGAAIDITLRIGLPQLELGAFATSVIPTTTAAATRSADVASITGANFSSWYNQTEGTVFVDIDRNIAIASASTAVSINDNSLNNRLFNFRQDSASQLSVLSVTGGSLDGSPQISLINTSARNKVAAAQAINNLAVSANGGTLVADTSVAMPTVSQMQIGNVTNSSVFNGTIRRLTYWPSRLPNATLQQITR